jgi:hypothetical protein
MKKKIKPLLLLSLLAVFCVLLFIPTHVDAGVIEMSGIWIGGKYGVTCACPHLFYYNCGCRIILEP